MHCYYSNLIEGQQTRVRDIEAALKKDFAAEPKRRDLQQLSLAHLEVQRWAAGQAGPPFATDFIRELHRRFYAQLTASPGFILSATATDAWCGCSRTR